MRRLSRALLGCAVLAASLVALTTAASPAATATVSGPAVSIDLTTGRYPISPGIYGMNNASAAVVSSLAAPYNRWGGNLTERYDWRTGMSNTGNDYYFENVPDCFTEELSYCANADHAAYRAWQRQFDADHAAHAGTVVTLPATGWVSKPTDTYGHPLMCAYPTSEVQSDRSDPYDACGDGKDADGNWIGGAVPDRTSVQVDDETLAGGWVDALKAAHGGVAWYEPGNEPVLWSESHHDLFGEHHLTAQEQWDRQSSIAAVAKAHDPTAKVMGPSEWGWSGYFCSDADTAGGGCDETSPDRAMHGGMDQSAWWLEQAKAWELAHGSRLIDAFDLHYYPQSETGPSETRSLWDPSYHDPSWIDDTVRMIPRMHDWVDQHYPGTKLVLGEYDFWHHDEPVGGVMEADALGIFARERLDIAMLWEALKVTDPAYWAMRMYRNADGHGRSFGTTYAPTRSGDQNVVSAYAATRSNGSLTLVLVNKSTSARKVPVSIKGFRNSTVHSFSYGAGTSAGLKNIVADPNLLELGGGVSTIVPAMGFQLLDFSGKVEQPLLTGYVSVPASAARNSTQTVTATLKDVDGPSASKPVMWLTLPAGSRIASVTPPAGWTCTKYASGKYPIVRCTAATLAADTAKALAVRVVMPATPGTYGSKVTATAYRVERPVPAVTRNTRVT
jgi:hypothetical protein